MSDDDAMSDTGSGDEMRDETVSLVIDRRRTREEPDLENQRMAHGGAHGGAAQATHAATGRGFMTQMAATIKSIWRL